MSQTPPPFHRQQVTDVNLLPQQLRDGIPLKIEEMWKYEFPTLEQELFIVICEISTNTPAVFRAFGCFRTIGRTNWQMTAHSNTNHDPRRTLNDLIVPFLNRIN